jgi:hypothetical protein
MHAETGDGPFARKFVVDVRARGATMTTSSINRRLASASRAVSPGGTSFSRTVAA